MEPHQEKEGVRVDSLRYKACRFLELEPQRELNLPHVRAALEAGDLAVVAIRPSDNPRNRSRRCSR